METKLDEGTIFRRVFFPFFFSAWLVGLGMGGILHLNEYFSYGLVIFGAAIAIYCAHLASAYQLEISATKRER